VAKSPALAYHNLSIMLDAGVPLVRSLNTVGSGLKPHMRNAFLKLAESASKGKTLAETMAQSPKTFNPVDITIIRAAETSGSLPESFHLLAEWHEFSHRIRKKLLSGMILPVLVIHMAALLIPVPAFALGGWQIKTYLISVVIILSLLYIPAALIFVILRMTPKTGPLRRLLDRLTLKIPLCLGRAVYKLALSHYCWVFHVLIKAGVPITDCAEKAAAATGNAVVTDLFKPAAASAKAGRPVSDGLSTKLPMDFLEIWRIGEETGNLDDVTKRLADNNAEDAEFWFAEFARWLPRVVYFLITILMIYFVFRFYLFVYLQEITKFSEF
jgi:general secretion pathway protein F/type IV pilus assembly protein PilC